MQVFCRFLKGFYIFVLYSKKKLMTQIYYLISRLDAKVGIWRIFFKGSFAECKEKKLQLWRNVKDDNDIIWRDNAKIVSENEAIKKYLGYEIGFHDLFT